MDGVDEASDLREEVEEYFVRRIAPTGVRIVVTSRPEGRDQPDPNPRGHALMPT